jgi:hypothetical protein
VDAMKRVVRALNPGAAPAWRPAASTATYITGDVSAGRLRRAAGAAPAQSTRTREGRPRGLRPAAAREAGSTDDPKKTLAARGAAADARLDTAGRARGPAGRRPWGENSEALS